MARWRLGLSVLVAGICLGLLPATARAQSAIGGTVKDASGAVLPGVTVEVTSDVLIEKTRSVSTDSQGEYKIVDLRPASSTSCCAGRRFLRNGSTATSRI